jgi:hypothetical protein
MLDAIGGLSADIGVQLVAGTTAVASLGAFAWAAAVATPRPCWTRRRGCVIREGNENACATCSVYLRTKVDDLKLRGLGDLGEIRRLTVIGSRAE